MKDFIKMIVSEAYFNYHKQQHQDEQEQKQQSNYNDNYNYETNQYENYAVDIVNDSYYKTTDNDIINKIKCNNNNININGENTGDINLGNDGQRGWY